MRTVRLREIAARLLFVVIGLGLLSTDTYAGYPGYLEDVGAGEFAYIGTPSKWDPGVNTASFHGFAAPAGPMTPGGATWSIMAAGLSLADSGHVAADSTSAITTLLGGGEAAILGAALDVWAGVSGFTNLGMVADGGVAAGGAAAAGELGDIRIGVGSFTSATTLAHMFQPGNESIFGAGGSIAGDMHISRDFIWADDPTDTTADADFDLFTVALHEFGHGLGLDHSSTPGSVMEPFYAGARRSLHADDIAGITTLYSAIPEPGSMMLAALGTLGMLGYGWRRRKRAA